MAKIKLTWLKAGADRREGLVEDWDEYDQPDVIQGWVDRGWVMVTRNEPEKIATDRSVQSAPVDRKMRSRRARNQN